MKKLEYTPRSQIRSALRQLWLRSRERAAVLKASNYTCRECGVKQSRAKGKEVKIEVHHQEGVCNWEKIFEIIYSELLCNPKMLRVLCPDCHKKIKKSDFFA